MSNIRLNILEYGHTVCGPQWGIETSGEMFQRIYYVLGGSCTCTIGGRSFALQKDHLYIMPQHIPYTMSHDPSDPFCVLWQHICISDHDTGPHMICRHVVHGSPVWHVLSAMLELSRNMLVEYEDANDSVMQQLCSLMGSLLVLLEHEQPLFSDLDPRLVEVVQLISEHPEQCFSVQDLAHHAKLERSYFSRLFQSQLRIPAQTFLIRRRLELAVETLLQDGSVTEAAERSGYSDPKAFSRAFSNQYGITPAQYKKYHILQP